MTRFSPRPLLLAALLAGAPLIAAAHDGVHVEEPFALISPAGNSGAAFMRIDNFGAEDDRLIAATSDIAQRTELHTHIEGSDGVMRMVEVEEGFVIPAGGAHELARGGDHVMFLGITRAVAAGETITLTLTFEREGEVVVEVPVGAPMDAAPGGHGHGHGHGVRSD